MTPDIRELDAETRDRIAAGEVVERPASVVKELVENALDADADRIEVTVEAGGTDRIVVADDGVGMSENDAKLAVREHTTSKLQSIEDLSAIGTLGFRGEALHAIGSVARLRIETKPRSGTRGTELVVENGEIVSCGPVGCPEGTKVEVTDLFGAVPARRKYLKTEATEFDHVQKIVAGYALARPDVAISLERDGRESFSTTGDGDRRTAVMAVYGREVASAMVPVDFDGKEGPLSRVDGLVSHPETNRAGRAYMTTLIDGRYVTASAVREAIVDAYGGQLAPDRYPFAVVDLSVPPGGVDVNVHPRKLEVLFADETGVRRQVSEAVESALLDSGLLRSSAPRGRSAPEQTEVSHDEGNTEPSRKNDRAADESKSVQTSAANSEVDNRSPTETASSRDDGPTRSTANTGAASTPRRTDDSEEGTTANRVRDQDSGPTAERGSNGAGPESTEHSEDESRFRRTPTQRTLSGGETTGTPEAFDRLPSMTVLGQFDETYLVAESADGLVLVDQHAADERVNYEQLRAAFDSETTTQTLAEPIELELTARETALADTHGEALSRLGFRVQRPSERTLAVTTVPALLAERVGSDAPEIARDLLGAFVDGDPEGTIEAVTDDLLADLACHPSIKGNTSLREGTVDGLLTALDECENPYACPHGRPTVIEISSDEIEDRFERDYPGHSGRRR
ncbi:MAG: DNA mismatch repair endonuclease MutL [Natronomonas sp.]